MINTDLGEVKISREVINTIVRLAMSELDSISNIPKDATKKIHTKLPKVEIENNEVKVNVYVSFYYGTEIKKEVEKLQENIKNSIETMVELKVSAVNVYVYDIMPKEEN